MKFWRTPTAIDSSENAERYAARILMGKNIRQSNHKVQATLVMQQRAKEAIKRTKDPEKKANLTAAYKIWTDHLEKLKKKTKEMNK